MAFKLTAFTSWLGTNRHAHKLKGVENLAVRLVQYRPGLTKSEVLECVSPAKRPSLNAAIIQAIKSGRLEKMGSQRLIATKAEGKYCERINE